MSYGLLPRLNPIVSRRSKTARFCRAVFRFTNLSIHRRQIGVTTIRRGGVEVRLLARRRAGPGLPPALADSGFRAVSLQQAGLRPGSSPSRARLNGAARPVRPPEWFPPHWVQKPLPLDRDPQIVARTMAQMVRWIRVELPAETCRMNRRRNRRPRLWLSERG